MDMITKMTELSFESEMITPSVDATDEHVRLSRSIHATSTSILLQKPSKKSLWRKMFCNTTLTESRNIANKIPCERLYLKFEGNNPTGTQKDRIAFALAEYAKQSGFSAITTATCGNFGAAVAYAASKFNLKAHIYIPKGYHVPKDRLKAMEDYGAEILFIDGHYEDVVIFSAAQSKENDWFNANPGMEESVEVSINAYAEIANEIYRALRRAPNYVLVPVGNGTTLAGIYSGFKELLYTNKISAVPRMVAVSTRRGNPIIKSFKLKSKVVLDLKPEEILETKVNEPLTNWHSFDGQRALDAIYESNGFAEYATDGQMIEFSRLLKQAEGLSVLPASASTLAVLSKMTKNDIMLKGTYVAILTGRDGS